MSKLQNKSVWTGSYQPAQKEGEEFHYSIVKLRGLPWSSTPEDITKFFSDCEIVGGTRGVHIVLSRDNRLTGEAYVELASAEDLAKALARDRDHMGSRYIEVFRTRQAEFEWALRRQTREDRDSNACVKLRGLPFDCSAEEIGTFFNGLEIMPNGVTLVKDATGRSNGEAFVQFVNNENADKALKKHREKIGHRYIEIFRSSNADVRRFSDNRNFFDQMGPLMTSVGIAPNASPLVTTAAPSPPRVAVPFDHGAYRLNRFHSAVRVPRLKDYDEYEHWNIKTGKPPIGGGGGMFPNVGSDSLRVTSSMSRLKDSVEAERVGSGRLGNLMDRLGHNLGHVRHPLPVFERPTPWGGAAGSGGYGDNLIYYVHMRGLPFKARTGDINDFFKPIIPTDISIKYENNGRSTGEADVQFSSQNDAIQAMHKDKGHMQHRYIELFLNTTTSRKPREIAINDYYKGTFL